MTDSYYPNYNCRLCGKTFAIKDDEPINAMSAISRVTAAPLHSNTTWANAKVHYCDSGGIGLADFIGYAQDNKQKIEKPSFNAEDYYNK